MVRAVGGLMSVPPLGTGAGTDNGSGLGAEKELEDKVETHLEDFRGSNYGKYRTSCVHLRYIYSVIASRRPYANDGT